MKRAAIVLLFVAMAAASPSPAVAQKVSLEGLHERPRVLFTAERQAEVEELAKTDALLAKLIACNQAAADVMLGERPCWYEIPDGRRLLSQSRRCIQRTWAFSMAYRLTGQKRYAEAAIREMLTVAAFKDWNPSHFLDTAEMTAAVAVGYDWCYDEIDPDDRRTIREAIIRLGFEPGLDVYKKNGWWATGHNNWNQVCNGGLLLGALALADEEPEWAQKIIGYALKSIPHALQSYAPDGAYPEGPGYWTYGTTYTALTIEALRAALGDDFGVHKAEGLDVTGDYRMHVLGPFHRRFNYADGGDSAWPSPTMFALARTYEKPLYAWYHRDYLEQALPEDPSGKKTRSRFFAMEIAWYDPRGEQPASGELPKMAVFRGVQDIATMRTAWGDPNAVYVGVKGGNNRASHGHLDIGSFILDAGGVRWAIDFGSDDYNMPGYFGAKRWTYYRMNNRSHNTLVIGDELQNTSAISRIADSENSPEASRVVIDMTDAYQGQLDSARRTVRLGSDGTVRIEDRLEGVEQTVRWGMVTAAEVMIDADKAMLTDEGRLLNVELDSSPDANWETVSTRPPSEIERQNKGTRMLATFVEPDDDNAVRIVVTLRLEDE